ncbi:MAG: DUF3307 domain-containing protein, partial [Crocinitomicaceae bacterium]
NFEKMLVLTLKLLLAHLIGDFTLQPNKWDKSKRKLKLKSPYLYWHILVHAIALVLLLGLDLQYAWGIVIILISHFTIDLAKLYLLNEKNERGLFFVDQLLHLCVIICVSYAYAPIDLTFDNILTPPFILLMIAILSITSFSSICMKVLISKWKPKEKKTLKNAGTYIGMLERLFIFGFIVIDYWDGIGFLLAAKSVFRFGDLSNTEDRNLTEYILIGTLLSFGFAILISQGYLYILSILTATS